MSGCSVVADRWLVCSNRVMSKIVPNRRSKGAGALADRRLDTHRGVRFATLVLAAIGLVAPPATDAATTLAGVKTRDSVRCGVSEGILGFSQRDASGRWSGLDVDFCRALSAAVLGDPDKATLVPLRAAERFPALRLGRIDVLLRNTTWTLSREAGLGVLFAGVLLYDGQGFMVAADSPIESAAQLGTSTVCVEKGTLHGPQLDDWARRRRIGLTQLVLDSAPDAAAAFFDGRCGVLSSDVSTLAAVRATAPHERAFRILTEQVSKQPLGPAVRTGDDNWFTLVRWVLFALVAADEAELTRANVAQLRSSADPVAQRMLNADRELGRLLDIEPEWSLRAVLSVGNYSEIFERNLGRGSPLQLEPGVNRPWNRGGILFAPSLQ